MTSLLDSGVWTTLSLQLKELGSLPVPRRLRLAPTPKGEVVLGHARQIRQDTLSFMLQAMHKHGDVVRLRLGPWSLHALFHPDHVEEVLVKRRGNYTKRSRGYAMLSRILGNGLVTSEGDAWQRQRKLAAPGFQPHRIAAFAARMTDAALESADRLEAAAKAGEPVDLAAEMMHVTLDVVAETLLGSKELWDYRQVAKALSIALHEVNDRIQAPFEVPLEIPTPANLRLQYAMRILDKTVGKIITERRARPHAEQNDLLDMLMSARDEDGTGGMTDRQLRDEVMTIFLAGHETSANALSWTWYLLSKHADVGRRLRAELREVLGGRAPTLADLPHLGYARRVIQESMRLYPPVWGILRRVEEDDEIGGFHIPAGSDVVACAYGTHRHPAFWDNPEGFDPDRFLPERSEGRHRAAYYPFSIGSRSCIGNHFAMMELVLVLATLAQRYRFDLVPGVPVIPEAVITLRPKTGLWMTVHRA